MKENREFRLILSGPAQFRAVDENGKRRLSGYAAVFDQLSEDLGGFRERIAKGAFARSVKESDVRALWNHDSNILLGRSKSGTLGLSEDEHGLAFTIDLPDTQGARDVFELTQRGDVDGASFGFRTLNDHWEKVAGEWVRTLLEAELFDISPVTYPAYQQTEVSARGLFIPHPPEDLPSTDFDLLRKRLALAELEP